MPFTFLEAGVSHEVGCLVLEVSEKIWLLCRLCQMALLMCNTLGIYFVDIIHEKEHQVTRFNRFLVQFREWKICLQSLYFMAHISVTIKRNESPDGITSCRMRTFVPCNHIFWQYECFNTSFKKRVGTNKLLFSKKVNNLIFVENSVCHGDSSVPGMVGKQLGGGWG